MLDFFYDRPCRAEAIGEFSDITGPHGGETATPVGLNTSQVSKQACVVFSDIPVGPKPVDDFMDVRGPVGGEAPTPVGIRTSEVSNQACVVFADTPVGPKAKTQPLVDGVQRLLLAMERSAGSQGQRSHTRKLLDRLNCTIGERLPTIDLSTFRAKRFEWFPDQEPGTVTPVTVGHVCCVLLPPGFAWLPPRASETNCVTQRLRVCLFVLELRAPTWP